MTQIILAPRRPKGDGTEPVLAKASFQYRLAVSTVDGTGQAVKSVWSDPITITGVAKTIDLDPGIYEGLLVAPDYRGNPKGFVESSFRQVPVSGSAILWENLTQTSPPTIPSFATITQANLDALAATLRAEIAAVAGGGGGGGAPAGTGVGGRYKPEDLEGVGSTGVASAKANDPQAGRDAIGAGTSNVVVGTGSGQAADGAATQSALSSLTTAVGLRAPLASPAFTGNPTAPTPAQGDNDTSVATTAFVATAVGAINPPSGFAPIDSPAFTGSPTAPTPAAGSNSTAVATTAFVTALAVSLAQLPANTVVVVRKSGSTWPARPTSRADIVVDWEGADPSPPVVASGTGGMRENDRRSRTAV